MVGSDEGLKTKLSKYGLKWVAQRQRLLKDANDHVAYTPAEHLMVLTPQLM